jgi:hypothetical protein
LFCLQLSEVENLRKSIRDEKGKVVKMGQDLEKKGLDYYNTTPIDDLLLVRRQRHPYPREHFGPLKSIIRSTICL